MKCLETRRTPEGFRRRRYLREDGVRITTLEVPIEIWNGSVRHDQVRRRMESRARALARASTKFRGQELLRAGWKPEAVASELNVTTSCAQRWRRQMQGSAR